MNPTDARFDDLDEFAQFYAEELTPALRADPDVDINPNRDTHPRVA